MGIVDRLQMLKRNEITRERESVWDWTKTLHIGGAISKDNPQPKFACSIYDGSEYKVEMATDFDNGPIGYKWWWGADQSKNRNSERETKSRLSILYLSLSREHVSQAYLDLTLLHVPAQSAVVFGCVSPAFL